MFIPIHNRDKHATATWNSPNINQFTFFVKSADFVQEHDHRAGGEVQVTCRMIKLTKSIENTSSELECCVVAT